MKTYIAVSSMLVALAFCLFGASAAYAGAGDKIYVGLELGAGVAVVDASSRDAWGNIKTGNVTNRLKVSPDKKFVYVTVCGENKVKMIDVSTDAVVKELEAVPCPYAMELSPDGKRLLVGTENSIYVIDTETFKEVRRIGMDGIPQAIRITPDGGMAYIVAGDPEASLEALEMKGMKITRKMALPDQVYDMEMSPDGKLLYANATVDRKVLIIDAAKMKVTGEINAYGQHGIALSRDGSELWIQGPEGMITVYSLKENKVIAKVPGVGVCEPRKVAFSPDGKLVFAWPAGEDCKEIAVCDAALKKTTGSIRLPEQPRFLLYIER